MPVSRVLLVVLAATGLILTTGIGSGAGEPPGPDEGKVRSGGASISSSRLGPEFRICCGNENHQRHPSAVYDWNHGQYLVVQHEESAGIRFVTGNLIKPVAGPFSFFLISAFGSYDCCLHADAAYNGINGEYLAVWQQYNAGASKWEIYGRIFPWDGPDFTVPPFRIAETTGRNLKYPAVAWNSYRNEYMVVWQTETSTGQLESVGRRRVLANGTTPDAAGYVRQVNQPGSPDITYNPAWDEYLVVWSEVATYFIDIYGARLNRSGVIQDGILLINQADKAQQLPAVTTNEQDRYLVVWEDHRWVSPSSPDDSDIYGQFLQVDGAPSGGEVWIARSIDADTHPAVTTNPVSNEYVAVWQQSSGFGERISALHFDSSGGPLEGFEVAPGGGGDNLRPTVATSRAGYLVAYSWQSWVPQSITDLYGRFWSPHAVLLPLVLRSH